MKGVAYFKLFPQENKKYKWLSGHPHVLRWAKCDNTPTVLINSWNAPLAIYYSNKYNNNNNNNLFWSYLLLIAQVPLSLI